MKVVIVGGGAGGISTASNIRKLDKDIEITVLTRETRWHIHHAQSLTYCQVL